MKSLNKILIIILVTFWSIQSDSIDDLKSSASEIKDNVNNLQSDLDASADMFVQAKNLQNSINSLLGTVKTFITTSPENAKKVNNSIADEFRSLIGDVEQDLGGIAEVQTAAFTQEVAILSDSLNKTVSNLQQNLNSYIASFDPQTLLGYVFNMDTGDIINYTTTIKANINQAQLKANQQLNTFTNQLNTFIDTQLKNDKDLASKLKAKYAQKLSNEKININNLFSTIQKYLLDVAAQIVAIYNQINKAFIAIVNDLIHVLTHIKNITEGSSDLFRAILNFPILPPVYTLGDTFQGTIKGMFLDFENDADQSKDILNEFILALTDLTKSGVPNFFYLIINIFKGIFNCPVGAAILAADIFAAVDNSNEDIQAIMNIVTPGADKKTQIENDMQAVIDQGTQIAHSVKDIVLIKYDPLNLALQNLLKNDVLVLLTSIIKIMQRGIDSINAFSRNIRVGLLCFNQPTIKYCPCSTVNLTGITKCLKDVQCPCSCPMNDALNQIVGLLNSLASQVDFIQNNIKEIETDILKTAAEEIGLLITGLLFVRSTYKWIKGKVSYYSYDEFEEQLANIGLSREQIKAATKNLDQKALNEMQDRYNEGLESPAKTSEFVSYLQGKLNLTKAQADLLNKRNAVWWKNSYDRIQKISKTFESIPNKVLNENVGRISEIFRDIDNAITVDDFYEAIDALSDITGIAQDVLVKNYVKAYTPESNRITPWEIQSKMIQDRAQALAELKNQADAEAQQKAGTVVDDSKEIAELQLDLKRLQDLKIQQPNNADLDEQISDLQEKINEDAEVAEPVGA